MASDEPEAFAAAYADLKRLAAHLLRSRKPGTAITATALVHEAYLKLAGTAVAAGNARDLPQGHFLALAARAMRSVLVDKARRSYAIKRGGGRRALSLDDSVIAAEGNPDLLVLEDALQRLEAIDARKSKIVELRFFGGLSVEEAAQVLEVSPATLKREWAMTKAWLYCEIGAD